MEREDVLGSSGHGEGWDGHHRGDDEDGAGPTLDDNQDGEHPSEPAVEKRTLRAQADERRLFANILATHREDTKALLSSVKSRDRRFWRYSNKGGRLWHPSYSWQTVHRAWETQQNPRKKAPERIGKQTEVFRRWQG